MQENQWPRNPVLTFWQSKRICSDNAQPIVPYSVRAAYRELMQVTGLVPQDVADELMREANYVFGHCNLEIYLEKLPKD